MYEAGTYLGVKTTAKTTSTSSSTSSKSAASTAKSSTPSSPGQAKLNQIEARDSKATSSSSSGGSTSSASRSGGSSPGPVQSSASNTNPNNIVLATAQARADAKKALDYISSVAPGSPAAQQAAMAYKETLRLCEQANATHNPELTRQAIQVSQGSVNYINNVATGKSPNTSSPHNFYGDVYAYDASISNAATASAGAPTIEAPDEETMQQCANGEKRTIRQLFVQIFGASASVEESVEVSSSVLSSFVGLFEVKTGNIKSIELASVGDSSKLFSGYVVHDVLDYASSGVGLKLNISNSTTQLNIALNDISIGYSRKNGDISEGLAIKLNLDDGSIALEEFVESNYKNTEEIEYIDYSLNWSGILTVILAKDAGISVPQGPFVPAIG